VIEKNVGVPQARCNGGRRKEKERICGKWKRQRCILNSHLLFSANTIVSTYATVDALMLLPTTAAIAAAAAPDLPLLPGYGHKTEV